MELEVKLAPKLKWEDYPEGFTLLSQCINIYQDKRYPLEVRQRMKNLWWEIKTGKNHMTGDIVNVDEKLTYFRELERAWKLKSS